MRTSILFLSCFTAHPTSFDVLVGDTAANDVRMAYIDAKMASIRSEKSMSKLDNTAADRKQDAARGERESTASSEDADEFVASDMIGDAEGEVAGATSEPQAGMSSLPQGPRKKRQRVRIGRNGKPLPPRKPRYVRTEEDVARDALVESLLSENRLENIYSPVNRPGPGQSTTGAAPGLDEDADRRAAEDFRREFMAHVEERNLRRGVPAPPGHGAAVGKGGDVMKGPKLGGSRSQRAAMKEKEDQAKLKK